jgi:DNA-binding NtrC family response regulator
MPANILIVDDESDILNILMEVFSRQFYNVTGAKSGKEALEILDENEMDVVISDERMPGMSGSELLSIVRKKFPHTIRIILTGHASVEAAMRAINEGEIFRFFTKPCNVVDLALTVQQALKQRTLMRETHRLLEYIKQQSSVMNELEKKYPGITRVKRNEAGAVLLEDITLEPEKNMDEEYDYVIGRIKETLGEGEPLSLQVPQKPLDDFYLSKWEIT